MAAVDDLAGAQRALANGQAFTYQGKKYTPKQIRDVLLGENGVLTKAAAEQLTQEKTTRRLTKQEQNLARREQKVTQTAINRAESELQSLQNNSNLVRQDFRNNRISETEYENYFNRIAQVQTDIVLMRTGEVKGVLVGPNRYQVTTPYGTAEMGGMIEPGVSLAQQPQVAAGDRPVIPGQFGTYAPVGNVAQTSGLGTGTNVGGGTGGAGTGGGTAGAAAAAGRRTRPVGDNWINVFKEKFPQYSYLLDETVFGADMTELLKKAVQQKWYDSDQLATLMEQGFGQTRYAQTTSTNQQNFDKLTAGNKLAQVEAQKTVIRDSYGNLQFTDEQLTQLATKAARDGKQGRALELYIFQEALAKPAGATDYSNQLAATRAITSNRADQIRQIGKDYGVPLSQREIEDVLTGKTSEEDLRQSYKMAARRWYKGIQEDLDAGLTVEQIFKPYRQYAAAILEKPIDQIDLTDQNGGLTVYADALQGQDGPLSLTDWARRLKADPKYGYQYTAQARQEVNNVVGTLEKAFGLTR